MSFKEYLEGVITDKNEFLSKIPESHKHVGSVVGILGKARPTTWWHRREELRIKESVYKKTAVTEAVNYMTEGRFSLHVSKNNRNLVAYTPGKDFGERDKQLPTSLGKFLAKYIPELEDHAIGELVAEHEAELNPDIRWLEGDAIVDYYAETTSVQSCMAHNANGGNKFKNKEHHPTQAYKAKGIKLAVLWKGGKDVARALTYEDTQKRIYIRSYGDASLRTWLNNNGYAKGNWVGVQFNTVKISEGQYVMPYLDANDGPGNGSDCNVALLDGVLTCVSLDTKFKLVSNGATVVCSTSTNGVVNLTDTKVEEFTYQDIITGEICNRLYGPAADMVYFGHIGGLTSVNMSGLWTETVRMRIGGKTVVGDVVCGTLQTFMHAGRSYEDSAEARENLGYVKLDKVLYPDEQDWVWRNALTLDDGRVVKESDCVVALTDDGKDLHFILKSELPKKTYKLGTCSKYGTFYGKPVYAGRDNPGIVVTRSGTRTSRLVSDITRLHDGTWIPSRFVEQQSLDNLDINLIYLDSREPKIDATTTSYTRLEWDAGKLWNNLRENTPHATWNFLRCFARTYKSYFIDCPTIKQVFNDYGYYYPRLQACYVDNLSSQLVYKMLKEVRSLNLEFIKGMEEVFAEKMKQCDIWYAEATAVEYPSEPVQLPVLELTTEPEVQNESAYYSAA